ncbi:sugar transferase [Chryseobacterium sp. OV279]|uniref:sugar transferase n=1 Tax=Chryseobacterium sp. OV279 TaxID=1500285 RepID=UPI00091F5656|nr:sugar transferase [Chryseobacterium sp. OV279]SHE74826.1 Sugar transferase involved in LPS biosynthesis (colanic, teichoic acid) [Chryseobacterium sp. OV279]
MIEYKYWKNIFDGALALVLIVFLMPLLIILLIIAGIDTASGGLFIQKRIGQYGKPFMIYKFRTIHGKKGTCSQTGMVLRKLKLDELPQLFNIVKGDMSFVGPRPDIEGYYDRLEGTDRLVLELKPGLTCEASIEYRNEEILLKDQDNPLQYNDEVLFPHKVRMNLLYLENRSFRNDMRIMWKTLLVILN